MPTLPEGGDVRLPIGSAEVLRELDAKQDTQANGDVAVAAEIEVDPQTVAKQERP